MASSSIAPPSVHEDGSHERLAIDTIRTLAMDAVQKANSGHPGTPMALAPVGYTLWRDHLRYDPATPDWPNRDRFVLSVGHASMLLYSLIMLAGIEEIDGDGHKTGRPAVSLDDIKQFRQLGSKTPGHPEYRMTTGVETTTGPLGQGCANAVGMAIAERALAAHFNRDGFTLFDHDVYVFAGDGDMMEGVSQEAGSLAGHLALSNLCWVYDCNHITIEGDTSLAFTEDVGKRFEGYGWNVIHLDDANDTAAFGRAIEAFKAETDRPTFIVLHSVIGYGSPIQGTQKAHSDAMGEAVIRATKAAYGWPQDAQFLVPDGVEVASAIPCARAAALRGRSGRRCSPATRPAPGPRRGTRRPALGQTPQGMGQGHPDLPDRRQGDRVPRVGRQGAQRHCASLPDADRRRRRPGPLDQDTSPSRARERSSRAPTADATCTSACASTPWARSPMA